MKNKLLVTNLQDRLEQIATAWSSIFVMLDESDDNNKALFNSYDNLHSLIKMAEKNQLQLLSKKELKVVTFFKIVLKDNDFHARYHLHDLIACYFRNDYQSFLETSYDDIIEVISYYFTEYVLGTEDFPKRYYKIWKDCLK